MKKDLIENKTINIKILKLTNAGLGMGKFQNKSVLVHRGLPGDTAEVRLKRTGAKYCSAEIVKIISPSPDRINPQCAAFEKGCGGCQLLHLDYKKQLFWKHKNLMDTLKNCMGVNIKIPPLIGMKNPEHFRNKLSLTVDGNGFYGFSKEFSIEKVDIKGCRMELDTANMVYDVLQKFKPPRFIEQIHIRCSEKNTAVINFFSKEFNGKIISEMKRYSKILTSKAPYIKGTGISGYRNYAHLWGAAVLKVEVKGSVYELPINSFFQTNYAMSSVLIEVVEKFLNLSASDTLLDLYCGVGLFGIYFAPKVKSVIGIENNISSIQAAGHNAEINKLNNCKFYRDDVSKTLSSINKGDVDAIIIDPPRMGCEPAVLSHINRIKPNKIVYVSCDYTNIAKDLDALTKSGYSVKQVQPIDMFPHTFREETVLLLERGKFTSYS